MPPKKTKSVQKRKAAYPTSPAKKGKAGWLVMLYLAGDNNLSEEMVLALQDLQAEGGPAGGTVRAGSRRPRRFS